MTHSKASITTVTKVIDGGFGKIEYIEPDNLMLQFLMENLDEAIAKQGAKKVSEILNGLR